MMRENQPWLQDVRTGKLPKFCQSGKQGLTVSPQSEEDPYWSPGPEKTKEQEDKEIFQLTAVLFPLLDLLPEN